MNIEPALWLSMAAYAIGTSITPGPNNTMLLASGVNFGFRASLPLVLGINLGGLVLWVAVGLGLGQLFSSWPHMQQALRWVGLAYVLYLSWRTWTAGAVGAASADSTARPVAPWTAAAFQWVNPKVWFMVLGYFGTFLPERPDAMHVVLASVYFSLLNLPCISLWAYAGSRLQRYLSQPAQRRVFNALMALLLVVSMLPMLI
jgi:threonine/homoserine/homoserine lactone efflux protein